MTRYPKSQWLKIMTPISLTNLQLDRAQKESHGNSWPSIHQGRERSSRRGQSHWASSNISLSPPPSLCLVSMWLLLLVASGWPGFFHRYVRLTRCESWERGNRQRHTVTMLLKVHLLLSGVDLGPLLSFDGGLWMSHCRKSMWHGVCTGVASKRNSGGVRRCQVQSLLSMLGGILVWAVSKNTCYKKAPVTQHLHARGQHLHWIFLLG